MHEVLVNRLRGLSLPRKSVVRLNDRPDMTLDIYRGRKTTNQQQPTSGNPLWRGKRLIFSGKTDIFPGIGVGGARGGKYVSI